LVKPCPSQKLWVCYGLHKSVQSLDGCLGFPFLPLSCPLFRLCVLPLESIGFCGLSYTISTPKSPSVRRYESVDNLADVMNVAVDGNVAAESLCHF